ncbi:hypothetical protein JXQ70_08195 [bacterium]|nr:hypothetical protein [bacterium]
MVLGAFQPLYFGMSWFLSLFLFLTDYTSCRARLCQKSTWTTFLLIITILLGFALLISALFPVMEAFMVGSDATIYLCAGMGLADSGTLTFSEPLMTDMTDTIKNWFFQNRIEAREEWVRYPGGFIFRSPGDDHFTLSFLPLFPVWIAVFVWLGGAGAAPVASIFFGAIGLVVLGVLASILSRDRLAGMCVICFAVFLGMQHYYSRFPTSEILAQFYFLTGLYYFIRAIQDKWPWAGFAASLAWSLASLTRFDVFLFIVIGLVVIWLFAPCIRNMIWPPLFVIGSILLLPLVIMFIHNFSTYAGVYLPFLEKSRYLGPIWRFLESNHLLFSVMFVSLGPICAYLYHRRFFRLGLEYPEQADAENGNSLGRYLTIMNGFRLIAFLAFSLLTIDYFNHQRCDFYQTVRWLSWYCSQIGLIVMASLICAAFLFPSRDDQKAFFVVVAFWGPVCWFYLYTPQIEAYQIWAVRRFVPMIIPLGLLLACHGLFSLTSRWSRRTQILLIGLVTLFLSTCFFSYSVRIMAKPMYRHVLDQIREVDRQLPPGSMCLFERQLSGLHLHTALNFIHKQNTFILQNDLTDLSVLLTYINERIDEGKRIFLFSRQFISAERIPFLVLSKRAREYTIRIDILESTLIRRAERTYTYDYPFKIYEIFGERNLPFTPEKINFAESVPGNESKAE